MSPLYTEKGRESQTCWQAMGGLKSDRTVGVEGMQMQILCEERRVYGAESEVNWRVLEEIFEDCHEVDKRQKKHKKEYR